MGRGEEIIVQREGLGRLESLPGICSHSGVGSGKRAKALLLAHLPYCGMDGGCCRGITVFCRCLTQKHKKNKKSHMIKAGHRGRVRGE